MTSINNVGLNSLTQADILRMPMSNVSYQEQSVPQEYQEDVYTPQEKSGSGFKKLIFGLAIIAAGIVGLKHFGKNSFLQVADNSDKFIDKFKKGILTTADYIEKPFVKTYNWIKGKFGTKATEAAK